jgi:hypothetical protein
MTTTNSWGHIVERFFIGLVGTSIPTAGPMASWMEANVTWTAAWPQVTQAGTGITFVLLWMAALFLATREPEPHFYGGAPEKIRTPDPQIRSLVLYPTELPARNCLTRERL